MSKQFSNRAQQVSQLWKLKILATDRKLPTFDYIHFNSLLNDPEYRQSLVDAARRSGHKDLRELAVSIAELDMGEKIAATDPNDGQDAAAVTDPVENNSTESSRSDVRAAASGQPPGLVDDDAHGLFSWRRAALAATTALTLGVSGYLVAGNELFGLFGGDEKRVSGSILEDTLWSADKRYLLEGVVYVEAGARLTIEPGTIVVGAPRSALVVTRDATLHARGTADKPIIFTSGKRLGTREAGDWGGLVLLGNAPVNRDNAQIEGLEDGNTHGYFGGTDFVSSCGILEYVRVEFAGYEVYANNELNGLTLGGCGSNTIIRHVQVHRALDDGIEVFGGTVDLKNIVISGAADDGFDWDMGWQGRVQFLAIQQYPGVGDNGFEGDNSEKSPDAIPRSAPVFYNVTLIGPGNRDGGQRAMNIRRGSGGTFRNVIISDFPGESIDIRDQATVALLKSGELTFDHLLIHNIGRNGKTWFSTEHGKKDDDGGFIEADWFSRPEAAVRFGTDPRLPALLANGAPDFTPRAGSAATVKAAQPPQDEFWDEGATYLGAVRPGVSRSWIDGWTDYPVN